MKHTSYPEKGHFLDILHCAAVCFLRG